MRSPIAGLGGYMHGRTDIYTLRLKRGGKGSFLWFFYLMPPSLWDRRENVTWLLRGGSGFSGSEGFRGSSRVRG